MDVGAHEEDRSADANHNPLNPLKNAWLQHFDSLIGLPIEILWLWAPTKRIVVLEPITNAWLQHFDRLSGRPIEIVWAWVTFERIVVLEPITIDR
jgi:hypothetical protein